MIIEDNSLKFSQGVTTNNKNYPLKINDIQPIFIQSASALNKTLRWTVNIN